MTIRAVIWDMGGVLLRTEDHKSRERQAEKLGLSRDKLEEMVFWGDYGSRAQLGEYTVEQHKENLRRVFDITSEEMTHFWEEFWAGDRVDMELIEYIRSLRSRYKTCLLSNAFSNLRRVIDEVWNFSDAFDEIIISAEVGLVKPDDRIYRLALDRLNVNPEEAVFIDDFLQNIEAARLINMKVVHFENSQQARTDLENLLSGDRS